MVVGFWKLLFLFSVFPLVGLLLFLKKREEEMAELF